MKPYPIFLVGLENRHCVVVGGGDEAAFKARQLLEVEANVTVISAEITDPELQLLADTGEILWIDRDYQAGDLRGAWIVIAERRDAEYNQQIFDEAEEERALVTVLDSIPHCNAVAGSVVRQGNLVMAFSTSGSAPALAVRLRQRFEKEFDWAYGIFLNWMKDLRPLMKQRHPKFIERKQVYYQLIDADVIPLIRSGNELAARGRLAEIADLRLAFVG